MPQHQKDEEVVVELDNTRVKPGRPESKWQKERTFWDKFWYDNEGRLAIAKKPNIWLIGWATTWMGSHVFLGSKISDVLSWAAFGLIIIWALLEAIKGESYFRRMIGILVFLLVILVRF